LKAAEQAPWEAPAAAGQGAGVRQP
jgi:hypothetical protein